MSKTESFQTDYHKLMLFWFSSACSFVKRWFYLNGKPQKHLLGLTKQLHHWNIDRNSRAKSSNQSLALCEEEVNSIKELIRFQVLKSHFECSEVVFDQLFFLTLGAIQIQNQTGTDKAWSLLDHFIINQLDNQKGRQHQSVFVIATTLLFLAMLMSFHNVNSLRHSKAQQTVAPSFLVQENTDPVTISMLQLAYQKMKSGICQYPQAAMLPTEQREAFLKFVNAGTIDVNNVENLRLALGYVNCLYPQELMRPQLPQ